MSGPARTFTFTAATRSNVSLIIGLAGGTGSGKTYSAMRLAKGLAAGKRFAVIDTEAGRARHYADLFDFDHGDLGPPFDPSRYTEAIAAADDAGYPVVLVDSCSHEWAGDGGILEMQEAELDRMAGTDWRKREACKMASWIKPKAAHKRMVSRLLQMRAHLILCFRSEPKIEMAKDGDGKLVVRPKASLTGLDGWLPICEKNLPFELTASFLLMADRPGVPRPIKLQEQHRPFFPLTEPITERAGEALGAWARGGQVPARVSAPDAATGTPEGKASLRKADELDRGQPWTEAPEAPESDGMGSLFPGDEEATRDAAMPWIASCHELRDGDMVGYRNLKKRLDSAGLPENVRALIRGPLESAKQRAGGK